MTDPSPESVPESVPASVPGNAGAQVDQAADSRLGYDVADGIATITIRRADKLNALLPDMILVMADLIERARRDAKVRCLVLRGEGKSFCAGDDLHPEDRFKYGPPDLHTRMKMGYPRLVNDLMQLRKPVVAMMRGHAVGAGFDLALACDFRIGVDSCEMFMPAARLGLHYYKSGIARYVSRLGVNAAKKLFLTAQKIDAAEMLRIGYLTAMTPAAELDREVDALAATLAGNAPAAMRGMKRTINEIARGKLDEEAADRRQHDSMRGDEIREGVAAYKEKRKPRF